MDELDQRSEAIERAALLSLHEHCPDDARDALGLFLQEVDGAMVCGAEKDPSILLNRTLGVGVSQPATAATLRAIRAVYEKHGVGRYFLHVYPDTLEGVAGPEGVDHELCRGWMKFRRGAEAALDRSTDLRIQRVGEEGAMDFGRIVAKAFGMTDAAAPLLAGLVHDDRWNLYVSYDGASPAGAGSLFVEGNDAWFEWGATYPEFRRRGSQGAIMTARIRRALELGCTAMFTETGEAAGDDPQHSYRNIERYGFEQSVLRQNWSAKR